MRTGAFLVPPDCYEVGPYVLASCLCETGHVCVLALMSSLRMADQKLIERLRSPKPQNHRKAIGLDVLKFPTWRCRDVCDA